MDHNDTQTPPNAEASVAEASVAEASVAEASVAEASVAEASVAEASVAEASVAEASVAEASVAEASVAEASVAETPTETISELTEVNPDPPSSDEGVAMKVTETTEEEDSAPQHSESKIDPRVALMQMPVNNQNDALNCLIGFVGIAQRRGVYALDEAAKAFHCIQLFTQPNSNDQESK